MENIHKYIQQKLNVEVVLVFEREFLPFVHNLMRKAIRQIARHVVRRSSELFKPYITTNPQPTLVFWDGRFLLMFS